MRTAKNWGEPCPNPAGSESSSTVSPGNLERSFVYVQWSQSLTLFPMIEAGKLIAPQALLAFGQHLRHRAALKRLAQDHRDALANLR